VVGADSLTIKSLRSGRVEARTGARGRQMGYQSITWCLLGRLDHQTQAVVRCRLGPHKHPARSGHRGFACSTCPPGNGSLSAASAGRAFRAGNDELTAAGGRDGTALHPLSQDPPGHWIQAGHWQGCAQAIAAHCRAAAKRLWPDCSRPRGRTVAHGSRGQLGRGRAVRSSRPPRPCQAVERAGHHRGTRRLSGQLAASLQGPTQRKENLIAVFSFFTPGRGHRRASMRSRASPFKWAKPSGALTPDSLGNGSSGCCRPH